ncbi:hypothetical protein FC093_23490 [Ilyomonas limi]|uniref:Uncharacterized protein n=1 Tax=Ilyomonas limi TaxID=2575867 RepID=A0A4U3KSM2_9BACT|nr:hypothetical protein [Ilyomonas limi]TKK63987.1 hypothetical protein FC093_23490 [Ilyomonas limi]
MPLGASKMDKILCWVNQIEPLDNISLDVFIEYHSKILSFPLGTERLQYGPDFLKQQDTQLDAVTMQYKDKPIIKCFEIKKQGASSGLKQVCFNVTGPVLFVYIHTNE